MAVVAFHRPFLGIDGILSAIGAKSSSSGPLLPFKGPWELVGSLIPIMLVWEFFQVAFLATSSGTLLLELSIDTFWAVLDS